MHRVRLLQVRVTPEMAPSAETDPLFVKNRRYLEHVFPEVAAAMAGCRLDPGRLLAVGDDDWDLVRRDGSRLYGRGADEFARAQENAFWADIESSRLSLPPPANLAVDHLANGLVTGCLRGAVDAGVQFFEQRCDNSAATVIVYGVGLGPHLTALMNRSECESMVLIEPDAELFFYSLFVFDWQTFVETVRGRGGDVGLLVGWEPGATAYTVMSWLNNRYPSLIDGTLFYPHYESDILAAIDRDFRVKYGIQVAVGLGFVEDELFMLNNSVRNLETFDGPMFRRGAPETGLPAFIVGSGPSIDRSIDRIKEFSDRAVIVSCGTALDVLLRNGVVPDLHAALENVPEAYEVLAKCAGEHDIRNIVLIASTTIDPRIPALFDTTVFFNRSGVSSYPVFFLGDESILHNTAPMVSNLALSFAREAGCRRFYLFGIDLGAKDPAAHHSQDSPYMRGELEYASRNLMEVPGNLGGVVHADNIHLLAKLMKEADINEFGCGRAYFNCSDGARIDGAEPLPPAQVSIPEGGHDKGKFRHDLLAHFTHYDATTFERQWASRDVVGALDAFRDRLRAAVEEGGDDYVDVMRLLRRLTRLASTGDTWTRTSEEMLFRGTLCLAMRSLNFFLARTGNPRDRGILGALVKEGLGGLIDGMYEAVRAKYAELGHPS